MGCKAQVEANAVAIGEKCKAVGRPRPRSQGPGRYMQRFHRHQNRQFTWDAFNPAQQCVNTIHFPPLDPLGSNLAIKNMPLQLRSVRTWVWNAGAFLFFAGLVVSALFYAGTYLIIEGAGLCEITRVQELASPDGKKIAKIGYSSCGATSNWQTGLQIEDRASGKVFAGLFGLDGKPDGLTLRWENNHTMVLSGFAIDKVLWFKQDYFSGVKVVLKP